MASFTLAHWEFTDPASLALWEPPRRAGLYAILAVKTPIAISFLVPNPFGRLIYIGESENMDERGFVSHHKRACWLANVQPDETLVVATHFIPIREFAALAVLERRSAEETIRRLYN